MEGSPVTHEEVTPFHDDTRGRSAGSQAGAMARGGDVFVLDMGQPVDHRLARRMVKSGLTVRDAHQQTGDVEIQITGLRPEKTTKSC
jgi:hypothetical protein